MRTALKNHKEVCEIWSQQNQQRGYAGNISFDGDTIYSYDWWPMAKFIEPKIVLFRDDSYSTSTSGHQSIVRSMIGHCKIFEVLSLELDHQKNIKHFVYKAKLMANEFWGSYLRCKWYMQEYFDVVKQAENYADYFGLLLPPLFGYELKGKRASEKIGDLV